MSNSQDLKETPPRPRKGRGNRFLALMQFAPLLVVFFFVTACSGTGGSGSAGDFFTSRRSNIFLRGFFQSGGNANAPQLVTSWNPFFVNNNNSIQITFKEVLGQLVISNGISCRLEEIIVNFTEVDGTDILDRSTSPPVAIAGAFDFRIASGLSMPANPITSIGAPLTEPGGANTDFFIPLQLFQSGIFDFQQRTSGTPNLRPFLAKITFNGRDILDNPYRIVGFLILPPLLTADNSNSG